jgi:hypothetical protein
MTASLRTRLEVEEEGDKSCSPCRKPSSSSSSRSRCRLLPKLRVDEKQLDLETAIKELINSAAVSAASLSTPSPYVTVTLFIEALCGKPGGILHITNGNYVWATDVISTCVPVLRRHALLYSTLRDLPLGDGVVEVKEEVFGSLSSSSGSSRFHKALTLSALRRFAKTVPGLLVPHLDLNDITSTEFLSVLERTEFKELPSMVELIRIDKTGLLPEGFAGSGETDLLQKLGEAECPLQQPTLKIPMYGVYCYLAICDGHRHPYSALQSAVNLLYSAEEDQNQDLDFRKKLGHIFPCCKFVLFPGVFSMPTPVMCLTDLLLLTACFPGPRGKRLLTLNALLKFVKEDSTVTCQRGKYIQDCWTLRQDDDGHLKRKRGFEHPQSDASADSC